MFRRSLLPIVRPRPSDAPGLLYADGVEENGVILSGTTRLPATGETYPVKSGYLDLLRGRLGGDNVAHLTNFLPGAGRGYEPLDRKSTRLNSSHANISYAVFCLKKKKKANQLRT